MRSDRAVTPQPPRLTNRFVRYMLAFGVSVAVGLAPLLGRVRVPLFTSILDLFPVNLRDSIIPFAAFLMALPAIAVQFYSIETLSRATLRRWFGYFFAFVSLAAVALYVVFTLTVVDVQVRGGAAVIRYVVGVEMLPHSPCVEKNMDIRNCIGNAISVDPTQVESVFARLDVQRNKVYLSLLYFAMMSGFGALIGTLILRENVKANS